VFVTRILVVNLFNINKLPPVISLIENLLAHDHKVTLVTYNEGGYYKHELNKRLNYIQLEKPITNNIFTNTCYFFTRKKKIRELIIEQMQHHDIIWTTTDLTVRELGKILFSYKHIMQLMELIEDMPAFPYQNIIKANLKKYAQKAWKVVVPEYNRANIQMTWWDLKTLPNILPNKPYKIDLKEPPEGVIKQIKEIEKEKRKIILYQGLFRDERRLDEYARAVSIVNGEYCLYIMGEDNEIRKKLCDKFPDVVYVPFIPPPYHLLVTQCAHIGLMPYIPQKNNSSHISELNALYCAPNKIYEYSAMGVPMIGTNVPGLVYPYDMYGIGICSELCSDDIIVAIKSIEDNYEQMKKNCYKFLNGTDLDMIVEQILN